MKSHLKQNSLCKKVVKRVDPVKIIGQRQGEKLALMSYDIELDVEWVYDIDVEETYFEEPDDSSNKIYSIETVLSPIWEDV